MSRKDLSYAFLIASAEAEQAEIRWREQSLKFDDSGTIRADLLRDLDLTREARRRAFNAWHGAQ